MTNSIFCCPDYIWAEELASSEKSLSSKTKNTLKKIATLASGASADCIFNALELFARAMAIGEWLEECLALLVGGGCRFCI